jgi:transposase
MFADFIPSRSFGRVKKYSAEAVAVVARVAEYYQAGQLTPEVRERLQFEFGQVIDIEQATKELSSAGKVTALEPAQVQDLVAVMQRQNQLLEALAEILQRHHNQEQELEQLRERLERLENRRWWRFWKL